MQASLSSTRSFLSSRGKFKSLHRRKNSTDSTATTKSTLRSDSHSQISSRPISRSERATEASTNSARQPAPEASPARSTRQPPFRPQVDDSSSAAAQWHQASYDQFTEAQSEKQFVSSRSAQEAPDPRTSEETMKEVGVQHKPFQGLDYPSDVSSNKRLIEDEILKTAFGITMSRGASTEGLKSDKGAGEMVKVKIPKKAGNTKDVYEMDVPLHLLNGRMPELETAISAQHATATRSPYQGSLSPIPQSAVSALSPESERRDPIAEHYANHLSVLSPIESLQSPTPRRPFSTASFRNVTSSHSDRGRVAPAIPSANSMSSNATSEPKSLGRSYESPRSSMSSVNSDHNGTTKHDSDRHTATAESSPLHLDTTSLYHEALGTTRRPSRQHSRAASPLHHSPQRPIMMHRTGSSTSLRSTMTAMTNADVNKPLPPEPRRLSTISSQPSEGSSAPSRASSITIRQAANQQRNGQILPGSAARTIDVGRVESSRSSTSGVSLRSKYTPKDLDALDDAFMQRNPPNKSRVPKLKSPQPSSPLYMPSSMASPNRSQMSFANDMGLGIISEEPMRGLRQGSASADVLQVPRGPMRMEPTRRAPQPPKASQSNVSLHLGPEPGRVARKSQSSNHIGSQYREVPEVALPQRSTTMMVGSSSKADRILGKAPGSDPRGPRPDGQNKPWVGQRPDIQLSSEWVREEAPQNAHSAGDTASSSRMSQDEELGPEIERSPSDAHFDEIRKRLELLSPKDDPASAYQEYYQRNAHRTSDALRPEDAGSLARDIRTFTTRAAEQPRPVDRTREEPRAATHPQLQPRAQSFIAELEAPHYPYPQQPIVQEPMEIHPVELEGTAVAAPVEMGLPSPKPLAAFPSVLVPPPEPAAGEEAPGIVTTKRGRVNQANPLSGLSANSRSLHSHGSTRVRSLASLAASDIPEIYAQLGSAQGSHRPSMHSMSAEEIEMLVSAETAEKVLLRILCSLDNFSDLFNAARVSRGFYRTFKRHELPLLKLALSRMSPAAWELREMSVPYDELDEEADDYTPALYFNHYVRDMMTMIELKALILDNCKTFLRQDTLLGLAGETDRASGFDDAFWRIWSFCRIFGCGNNREDDIMGQMDWLRGGPLAKQSSATNTLTISEELAGNSILFNPPEGFAAGNGSRGLSTEELYDMFELWTCLGVLLQGYQGCRDIARAYGVFSNSNILQGDVEREDPYLEEWTYHLLAHAPSTILDVASVTAPTDDKFAHVQLTGHTEWTPPSEGSSRSTFLKEAVSRVYEEKLALTRPQASRSPRSFSNLPQVVTPPSDTASSPDPFLESRQRAAAQAAELRAAKKAPTYRTTPISPDRPMSNFNEVLHRLERLNTNGEDMDAPPLPKAQSSLAARFSRRKPKGKPSVKPTPEATSPADSAESSSLHRREQKNRMASLRERVTGRHSQSSSTERIRPMHVASPLHSSEKLPVTAEDLENMVPRGPQVRDPVDIAVERLVEMGFDEAKARKALAESDLGDRIDVEKATQLLVKQKKKAAKKADRLARLETMG